MPPILEADLHIFAILLTAFVLRSLIVGAALLLSSTK